MRDTVSVERPLLRVLTGKLHGSGIGVAPCRRIIAVYEQFAAKVQDVLAADHRHNIRRIKYMLLVNRVALGLNPRIRIGIGELDSRNRVCLGELPPKLRGVALAQCQVLKEVALPGVTQSRFVNSPWTDIPNIRHL